VEHIGGTAFLFWGRQIKRQKNTKIKYSKGLRWLPFNILHATTNHKHTGLMEGGKDRTSDVQGHKGSTISSCLACLVRQNMTYQKIERRGGLESPRRVTSPTATMNIELAIAADDDKYAVGNEGVG
jgi:hypothetical protein